MKPNDNSTKTYLALGKDELQSAVDNLRTILANSVFMYQLYKNYHWHVTGKDFYQYHLLFDKHANEQLPIIDTVAERLRTLGADAPAMPADVVGNTSLTEPQLADNSPTAKVKALLECHQSYIELLRETIKTCDEHDDEGTSDLLVSEVLRVHELELWFLRSSL